MFVILNIEFFTPRAFPNGAMFKDIGHGIYYLPPFKLTQYYGYNKFCYQWYF